MGQTRVDLLHLLEDLRDAYPGSLEETLLTEIVANSLDSGARRVVLTADPAQSALLILDDGAGMKRAELARYHDVAASRKLRGEGIGFAGVGIKLGLLASSEVMTETCRGATSAATRWRLASRHRAPWKWAEPAGLLSGHGTAVSLRLRNPLSPLLDPGFLEETLRRHFQPLFDPVSPRCLVRIIREASRSSSTRRPSVPKNQGPPSARRSPCGFPGGAAPRPSASSGAAGRTDRCRRLGEVSRSARSERSSSGDGTGSASFPRTPTASAGSWRRRSSSEIPASQGETPRPAEVAEIPAIDIAVPGRRTRRRPVRLGLKLQFESRPESVEPGRLAENIIWINEAHPAYRRAAASRSEGYHIALSAAMALSRVAVEPPEQRAFVNAFMARWGQALDRPRKSRPGLRSRAGR